MPSVCLDIDEQAMKATRESEDINTHHLLQQHLYKSRKNVSSSGGAKLAGRFPQEGSASLTLVVCSTVTATAGPAWASTRTKMRCRRSSRGP